jgi:integrase
MAIDPLGAPAVVFQPEDHGPPAQPKLLDRVRRAIRTRHYSPRTEQAYVHWIRRYIFFHKVRHPADMGKPEINAFLSHLAVKERVSASTQTQALSALVFLYRHVLGRDIGQLEGLVRARRPGRAPVVLTRGEVRQLLAHLDGVVRLVCTLLYGSGLRLLECLHMRIKDIDFERNEIAVRDGKGRKDRVTTLPAVAARDATRLLARVEAEAIPVSGCGCEEAVVHLRGAEGL